MQSKTKWLIYICLGAFVVFTTIFVLVVCLCKGEWQEDYKNAFSLGGMPVAWYGLFVFFGFFCAIVVSCLKLYKIYNAPIDPFYWFCLLGVPIAIAGARMWSFMIGDAKDWSTFFDFKNGGLAVQGGVILTVILGFIYFPLVLKLPKFQVRDELGKEPVVRKVSFLVYFDVIAPSILVGQIIGRYGNYFNQEVYGQVVNDPNLINFLNHCFPWMKKEGEYLQPLFLWESLLNVGGFIIVWFGIELIKNRKAGTLAITYFLWYGLVRVCLEPLRSAEYTFALTYVMDGLWIGFGVVLLILNEALLYKLRKYNLFSNGFKILRFRTLYKINLVKLKSYTKKLNSDSSFKSKYLFYKQKDEKLKNELDFLSKKWIRKEQDILYYGGH